jgi:two-component system chemotaxis response regulator CheB
MPPIKVLIVDDAVMIRKMVSSVLNEDPDIEVVGTAANGKIALMKFPQLKPDIISCDIEMPEMDGLTTVREIRKIDKKVPIIMYSTLSQSGASITLQCMSAGATDYVTKPANVGSINDGLQKLREELIPKIKSICLGGMSPGAATPPGQQKSVYAPARKFTPGESVPKSSGPVKLLCIGSSTGGPNALMKVFETMPKDMPVPIVMVQHMPPMFTKMLAKQINDQTKIDIKEGEEGEIIQNGKVYLAPGGKHMELKKTATGMAITLHEGPQVNFCRPAVDPLFDSAVKCAGGNIVAVILTGMGSDGLHGCENIRAAGGYIIAQDEATSVVWGMPGHVAKAGVADEVLPLHKITDAIVKKIKK